MILKKSYEILKILLKDISRKHTVTSLSKERKISRVGSWKLLKELEKESLVTLFPIGPEKTSVKEVKLNWDNPLLEKILALLLTEDALKQKKWRYNFKELENHIDFLILFGSILHSPKEANDIDILIVVKNRKEFKAVEDIILEVQQTQIKKIHAIDLTKEEFKIELKENNKAYIDALKKRSSFIWTR